MDKTIRDHFLVTFKHPGHANQSIHAPKTTPHVMSLAAEQKKGGSLRGMWKGLTGHSTYVRRNGKWVHRESGRPLQVGTASERRKLTANAQPGSAWSSKELHDYFLVSFKAGTSAGAKLGWQKRGRGGKAAPKKATRSKRPRLKLTEEQKNMLTATALQLLVEHGPSLARAGAGAASRGAHKFSNSKVAELIRGGDKNGYYRINRGATLAEWLRGNYV